MASQQRSVKASAGLVLLPPTVISPATCSADDATTPRLAAAFPKMTCAPQEMARVCRQPNVKPTPTVMCLVRDVPPMTSCAVWRTGVDGGWDQEVVVAAVDKVSGIYEAVRSFITIIEFG